MNVIIMTFCIGICMIILAILEPTGLVQISDNQVTAISLAGLFISLASLRSATDNLTPEPPKNSLYFKFGFSLLAAASLFIFPYALHHFDSVQSSMSKMFTLFGFGVVVLMLALQEITIKPLAIQKPTNRIKSGLSVMTEEEYIINRLDDQINWYAKKSSHNQKRFKTLRTIEVTLSLSLPIIIGYIPAFQILTLVASLLGAAVAFIATLLAIGKYHEIWVEYRMICEVLRQEKIAFTTRTGHYATENPFPILVERAESIMCQEHAKWMQVQKPTKTS